jgi:hypothetical protein
MQIKPINLNIQYNRLQEVFDFRFYGGEGGLGSILNIFFAPYFVENK